MTTDLLDLNPDNYTFWNIRREIFLESIFPGLEKTQDTSDSNSVAAAAAAAAKQKLLLNEIHFVLSKMKVYPKSYWLWNHRSWCINQFPEADWNQELGLVDYLLSKDQRNFHGWHYRRIVIDKLNTLQQYKPAADDPDKTLVQHEFRFTTLKINQDFSNFSAWYNRALLIPSYLTEKVAEEKASGEKEETLRIAFLDGEINYVQQALFTDPDLSSAWFYHKWLYNNLQRSIVPGLSTAKCAEYLQKEIDIVEELAAEEPENSYCLLALVYLRDHMRSNEQQEGESKQKEEDSKRVVEVYNELQKIDPLRRNMYADWKATYLKGAHSKAEQAKWTEKGK